MSSTRWRCWSTDWASTATGVIAGTMNETATATGTPSGLFFVGLEEGYSFSLPADTSVRTATFYLGGYNSRGRLDVSLSDGSAAPFSTTYENASGVYDRVVTISYSAASAGQALLVSFVNEQIFGSGNVTLAAVALAGGAPVNQPPTLDAIGDRTVTAGETLTINVSAEDADGPAPLVLGATPLPGGAQFNDLGGGAGLFEWTPGTGDVIRARSGIEA